MKIKTSELTGAALDWAVAKCEGIALSGKPLAAQVSQYGAVLSRYGSIYSPSTDWAQGGPIIERERISVDGEVTEPGWYASICDPDAYTPQGKGPTSLIAAMRCYVASSLGDEIEIPDELGE